MTDFINTLKNNEVLQNTIIEHYPGIIYIYDLVDKKNVYINDKIAQILGYSVDEIQNMGNTVLPALMHPDDFNAYLQNILPRYNELKPSEYIDNEYRMKHKNGNYCWFESREIIIKYDCNKKSVLIFGIVTNMTRQREAEKKSFDANEKLRFFANYFDEMLWVMDKTFNYTYISPSVKNTLGYSVEEYMKLSFEQHFTPASQEIVYKTVLARRKKVEQGIIDDAIKHFKLQHYRKNGEISNVAVKTIPVYKKGEFNGLIGVTKCIDEEVRLQEASDANKEKFRLLVENANDIFYELTPDGIFTYVSPNLTEKLIYEQEEVINRHFSKYMHPDDIQKYADFLNEVIETGRKQKNIEYRVKHKNGTWRWHSSNGSPLKNKQNKTVSFMGVARDITEAKQREAELVKAKEKAEESEKKYRLLSENVSDGIVLIENDKIEYISPGYSKLMGYTTEFLKNIELHEIFNYIHPADRQRIMDKIANAHKNQIQNYRYSYRAIKSNGEFIWIEDSLNSEYAENGNRIRAIIRARDITKQKQDEIKLRESEERFKALFEASPDAIILANRKTGIIADANHAAERLFETKLENIIGLHQSKLHPAQENKKAKTSFKSKPLRANELSPPVEINIVTAKNNIRSVEIRGKIIEFKNEEYVLGTFRDITESKKMHDELEKSEKRFRLMMDATNDGLWDWNFRDNKLYFSPGWKTMLGYRNNELEDKFEVWKSLTHPDDVRKVMKIVEQLKAGERKGFEVENRMKHKDGHWIIVLVRANLVKDAHEKPYRLIGNHIDITDLKAAQKALLYQKTLLNSVLDSIPDMISIHDKNFNIVYSNWNGFANVPENKRKLGTKCYKTYRNYEDICPDCQARAVLETKKSFKTDVQLPEGQWFDMRVLPIQNEHGEFDMFVEWVRDITDLKQSELLIIENNERLTQTNEELIQVKEKIQENEQRLKLASQSAKLGIWDWNVKDNVMIWDERMYELYGISNQAFVKTVDAWLNGLHPEDKDRAIEECNAALKGIQDFDTTFRVLHPNGKVLYIKADGLVIKNQKGEAIRMIGINRDVTESKLNEIELKIAKEKAEEANKLKTEFLNNLSHEIRTPMNGIIGFSELLDKPNISDEKRTYYSKIIQNSSQQLLKIIDDILEISTLETRQQKINETEFNLNDLFMELFSIFNLKSKEREIPIYIKKALHNKQSFILTDKTKLFKILSNLLENALKYTNEGCVEMGYYIENDVLNLYVKDTGIGISPKNHQIIFERFSQEDKEVSRKQGGLGLGLSISKENAKLLGGDITLESEKGKGATFIVKIPYKPVWKNKNDISNKLTENTSYNGLYTILITEDEEINYLFMETLFEDEIEGNFKLIHARNGKEAVDICSQNKNIDLVLMDIKMPVMNGHEATEKIKEKFPDLPVIVQTAYSTEADKQLAFKHGCDDFISKPLNTEKLFKLISKYLKIK